MQKMTVHYFTFRNPALFLLGACIVVFLSIPLISMAQKIDNADKSSDSGSKSMPSSSSATKTTNTEKCNNQKNPAAQSSGGSQVPSAAPRSSGGGGGGGGSSDGPGESLSSMGESSDQSPCTPGSISSSHCTPSCPSGYTPYQSNQCCPSQYYKVVDTNGSKKGGKVAQCNIPDNNTTPSNPSNSTRVTPTSSSCTVNGTSVSNGNMYTFYRERSVPYNETCEEVERLCVNGTFSGDANTFSRCTVIPGRIITDIWIKATPPIVRYDGSSTISWDGGNAEACTVTGYGISADTTSGSELVEHIQGQSIYTLNCTLDADSKSASTTVKILPLMQET
jgi:hypothetical protein